MFYIHIESGGFDNLNPVERKLFLNRTSSSSVKRVIFCTFNFILALSKYSFYLI